jgi:hypothetical protein
MSQEFGAIFEGLGMSLLEPKHNILALVEKGKNYMIHSTYRDINCVLFLVSMTYILKPYTNVTLLVNWSRLKKLKPPSKHMCNFNPKTQATY